ncbi:MAG: 2-oxo acid dehydrogenase subunit E2, partial [Spirulina sp.]
VKTIGDTIADHKYSHAINYKQERQIAFDAVDIAMPIEREVDGIKVPLATIIRDTNTKTIEEINHEIKNAVSRKIKSEGDYVLTERKNKKLTGLFFHFPQWMRMIIWQKILKNPFSIKENMGTVMITNVGMVGRHSGWIIPKSLHNLSFGIGAVTKKPWVVKDKIEIREILHLTILFDHDVMDGAPAARFTDCLIRNLENAKEL